MELTPAVVRLPGELDAESVDRLTRDFAAACEGDARAIVVAGASEDPYCLGLAIGRAAGEPQATGAFASLLARMHHADRPLIAAVDGRAIGGGLGIACACDWVIATDRASFALPELVWGLVPAIIWPVIADRMAPHIARQWALTGHSRSAAEALAGGLVDETVAPERLAAAIRGAARRCSRLDAGALLEWRRWARSSRHQDLATALHAGAALTADMVRRPALRNRWRAFAEGGTPWSA
jgi:enoyl-CoA hydratase/carnithine racemase